MRAALRSSRVAASAAIFLVVMLPFAFTACGESDNGGAGDGTGGNGSEVQLAMSEVSRLMPEAPQSEVLAAAASVQQFGVDLYQLLAQDAGDGNLVFSPASIETALAMTYAGAAENTGREMADTLHFTLGGDALHRAFNTLDSILESRSWQQKNSEGKEEGVLVKTANSLWGQKDLAFAQAFLDTIAANYGAGIRLVDYKTAAEAARQAINEWVAGETADKIPELIPQGMLDALTRLVLVNAVYLDATWTTQFNKDLTTDGQFTTLAGEVVTTTMMSQETRYLYGSGDGWQAVELPYVGDQLAMLVIVPDAGRFTEIEGKLASGLIDDAVAALGRGTKLDLTMPKFEFRTQAGLNNALMALGMKSAFGEGADFSGMTTEVDLFISDVIHEAYIAVDEEGTEAAAATAVIMRETAIGPDDTLHLTIDRPFLFALRDRETGALLFLGRVTDPTK